MAIRVRRPHLPRRRPAPSPRRFPRPAPLCRRRSPSHRARRRPFPHRLQPQHRRPTATAPGEFDVVASAPRFIIPGDTLPAQFQTFASNNNVDILFYEGRLYLAWRAAPNHFAGPDTHLYIMSSADGGQTWDFEHDIFLGTDMREPRLLAFGGYPAADVLRGRQRLRAQFTPHAPLAHAPARPGAVVGSRGPHRRRRGAVGSSRSTTASPTAPRTWASTTAPARRRRSPCSSSSRPTGPPGPTSAAATTSTSAACPRWRSSSTSTAACGR